VDQRWVKRIDLLAKIRNIGLNDTHVSTEIVLPDVIQNLSFGNYAVCVDDQIAKQSELCFCPNPHSLLG
jgi:hypothetical protein